MDIPKQSGRYKAATGNIQGMIKAFRLRTPYFEPSLPVFVLPGPSAALPLVRHDKQGGRNDA